jgi:hypothetical protein
MKIEDGRPREGGFTGLEPYEAKVSRTVLRGRWCRNALLLPGVNVCELLINLVTSEEPKLLEHRALTKRYVAG